MTSKGLKALKRIGQFKNPRDFILKTDNGNDKEWHFETIKELFPNDFDTIEKELKVLKFLIKLFKFEVTKKKKLITWVMKGGWFELEQKDYDLLKEVLL